MSTATMIPTREGRVSTNAAVPPSATNEGAATGVGLFSLALGAAEIFAPCAVARLVGLKLNPKLVQLLGAREVASGVGILTQKRPTSWLWGRVAGDIMDLAVLGTARLREERGARGKLIAASAAVIGVTLIDSTLSARYATKGGKKPAIGRTPREELVHFLSDMYSVEQQALAQLISAPEIVRNPQLADDFRRHYTETEQQAGLVEQRLKAHGASASAIKNAVMKFGGKGFLLFARAMPETPGRLVVHSYSYEAMEWAGYEMLSRFADLAGDRETAATAKIIRAQERTMMRRLERGFDIVERMSHADCSPQDLSAHVRRHLAEVHAFESQHMMLLKKGADIAGSPALESIYTRQENESRKHARLVGERLQKLNSSTSKVEDTALAAGGLNWGLFFQAQSDTPAKFAAFVYAVLHLEIGGYEMLKRTAHRNGDRDTEQLCETIIAEKHSMADGLVQVLDTAVHATFNSTHG